MHVGQGLRLDALAGIDHQDRPLARLQASAYLVTEVDVARRVDEVQAVDQAVATARVLEPHGASLDRDSLFALEVHRVQHLAGHLARVDSVRQLEEAIGQRGLAVIDVGDDRKVAQAVLGDHVDQPWIAVRTATPVAMIVTPTS